MCIGNVSDLRFDLKNSDGFGLRESEGIDLSE